MSAVLTNDAMMEMNYEVDELGKEPREAAHDYLVEQGIIEK